MPRLPTTPAPQAAVAQTAPQATVAVALGPPGLIARMQEWVRVEGAWWATSFVFHMALMTCVLIFIGTQERESQIIDDSAPVIQETSAEAKMTPAQLEPFDPSGAPLDPSILTTESLTWTKSGTGTIDQTEVYYDDSQVFEERGGGMASSLTSGAALGGIGGYDIKGFGPGPAIIGRGGVGIGVGEGTNPGSGGGGVGFGGRGKGHRKAMVSGGGGTQASERAVAAALSWLARHQLPDGGWSLQADGPNGYHRTCKDQTCTAGGNSLEDTGATALALLPFLAAGQTHESKGPYQQVIYKGLYWLMQCQRENGDLTYCRTASGQRTNMYAHGLATITLCEAYGMSKKTDRVLREKAQRAVNFIISAQNASTGGWRYTPGEEGDTSVVGWQVMALKSAQMAGLSVNPKAFDGARQFLKSCSKGNYGGMFAYRPDSAASSAMTAVGLLCYQYMGSKPGDPVLVEGQRYMMSHLPDQSDNPRDLYYWYYATQVMHNMLGEDWDTWNRKMRKTLIETQSKDGCARGSWDPNRPTGMTWSMPGGRLMATSLSALTLEVYYRYLPLFKLDSELAAKPAAPAAEKAAK
jgi:prenyltransferase beta subunit